MDKQRSVNTSFWSDDYIVNRDIMERYFFLYLLTNEHTNVCGIYKIGLKVMARETGLDQDQLQTLINRFTEDKKMVYQEGWVVMLNHLKHQKIKGTLEKAVQTQLAELPPSIYTLAIQHGYPINTARGIEVEVEGEVEIEGEGTEVTDTVQRNKGIQEVIDSFKEVNPSYRTLFSRNPQRSAAGRLIDTHGKEEVLDIISLLSQVNSMPYAPVVTTPVELENKMGKVIAFIQKEKNKLKGGHKGKIAIIT